VRKVILYAAQSLDGFLADSDGGVGWIGGHDENYSGDYGYSEFFRSIDTIVMGYNTYRQVTEELSPDLWPYAGLDCFVLTHRQEEGSEGIQFTDLPIEELISILRQGEGKGVWICGGASIFAQCLEQDLIDEFHISVIPILLGSGIPLFTGQYGQTLLELKATSEENGVLDCVYTKRHSG